jgi:hypothetical protein
MNDYAEKLSKNEFKIKSEDNKNYVFRVSTKDNVDDVV